MACDDFFFFGPRSERGKWDTTKKGKGRERERERERERGREREGEREREREEIKDGRGPRGRFL